MGRLANLIEKVTTIATDRLIKRQAKGPRRHVNLRDSTRRQLQRYAHPYGVSRLPRPRAENMRRGCHRSR